MGHFKYHVLWNFKFEDIPDVQNAMLFDDKPKLVNRSGHIYDVIFDTDRHKVWFYSWQITLNFMYANENKPYLEKL